MCLGGHLVCVAYLKMVPQLTFCILSLGFPSEYLQKLYISLHDSRLTIKQSAFEQAAFDPRVKATFCWFATDIHSATLGKGKNDDSLVRVKNGDMTGKGELVVCA
jgi:hypothetical protein